MVFRLQFCSVKLATLDWGHPGLVRYILVWIMPQAQDRLLDLLTCSPLRWPIDRCYYCCDSRHTDTADGTWESCFGKQPSRRDRLDEEKPREQDRPGVLYENVICGRWRLLVGKRYVENVLWEKVREKCTMGKRWVKNVCKKVCEKSLVAKGMWKMSYRKRYVKSVVWEKVREQCCIGKGSWKKSWEKVHEKCYIGKGTCKVYYGEKVREKCMGKGTWIEKRCEMKLTGRDSWMEEDMWKTVHGKRKAQTFYRKGYARYFMRNSSMEDILWGKVHEICVAGIRYV